MALKSQIEGAGGGRKRLEVASRIISHVPPSFLLLRD
jgi:ABC-type lipopolysaccharide export system ATPase subunit